MKHFLSQSRTISEATVLGIAIVLATPSDAWAYIDPGTGSYLFQMAAAGLLGALFTLRRYWSALASVLRRSPGFGGPGAGEPRQ